MKHFITTACGMNVEVLDHSGTAEVYIDHQFGGPSDLREIASFLLKAANELDLIRQKIQQAEADRKAKIAEEAKKFKASDIVPGYVYEAFGDNRTVAIIAGRYHGFNDRGESNFVRDSAEDFASELNIMGEWDHVRKLS